MARLWHKTDNFEAWSLIVKAWSAIDHLSRENVDIAHKLAERAVQLDPKYGFAWSLLAYAHFHKAIRGWSNNPTESYNKAISLNLKALKLDNTLWCATALSGSINLYQGHFEKAVTLGEKSIALGPNVALNYPVFAQTLFYAGRFEEAIAMCKKGMRLQPYYPVWYLRYLGLSYRLTERYDDALKVFNTQLERAKKGETSSLSIHLKIADVYSELGEYKKARVHVNEALKLDANYSLKSIRKRYNYFKNPNYLENIVDSLRKAGLPEKPPVLLPDKPSIAVLPFANMSENKDQEYFSDGSTENIITVLSKTNKFFIIARNSTFVYKGKSVKVRQITEELGVR